MSENKNKNKIINRLKTIKGHIAGIEKMIEEDKSCDEILIQIAAIRSSINKVGLVIMKTNAEHCLENVSEDGKVDKAEIEKVIKTLINFSK